VIVVKQLEISVPEGLYEFIQELVNKNYFASVEDFIAHASHWLAELYGFAKTEDGKTINDVIVDLIVSKLGIEGKSIKKVETIVKELEIPNKDLILETFGSAKFMYETAIFTQCQIEVMRKGEKPISEEEFKKSLKLMEEAGILTKIEKNGKVLWKRN